VNDAVVCRRCGVLVIAMYCVVEICKVLCTVRIGKRSWSDLDSGGDRVARNEMRFKSETSQDVQQRHNSNTIAF